MPEYVSDHAEGVAYRDRLIDELRRALREAESYAGMCYHGGCACHQQCGIRPTDDAAEYTAGCHLRAGHPTSEPHAGWRVGWTSAYKWLTDPPQTAVDAPAPAPV